MLYRSAAIGAEFRAFINFFSTIRTYCHNLPPLSFSRQAAIFILSFHTHIMQIHSYTSMFMHIHAYSFIFMYMYTHSLLRDNTTSPSPGSSISFRDTVSEKKSLTFLLPEPRQVFLPGVHLPQPPRPFCLLPELPGPLRPHQLRLLQQPPQLPQHPLPLLRSR